MKKVLIVDDHDGFRAWLRAFVEEIGGSVVGEAATGADALAQVQRLRPQVVLLDIQLPDITGFGVAEQLEAVSDDIEIVLISSRRATAYREELTRSRTFISKEDLSEANLIAALGLAS